MHPILRNVLSLLAWIPGSIANMAVIILGHQVSPLPEGTDPNDPVSLNLAMEQFGFVDYLFPLLAHALGTAVAGYLATKIAASYKLVFAMVMGAFFFAGGIWAVTMLNAPLWFNVTDLVLAYFPMAYLGYSFAKPKTT